MSLPRLAVRADSAARHLLFVLPAAKTLPADLPERERWQTVLKRRDLKAEELAKSPLAIDFEDGCRAACIMVDEAKPRFDRLTALRKAAMLLLDEGPAELAIVPIDVADDSIRDAAYVTLINAAPLPAKKKKPAKPLKTLAVLTPHVEDADFKAVAALAEANVLARELTALPPNELPPAAYRRRIRALARDKGWRIEEFGYAKLKKMGAGAFCAVAQGSGHKDAAIVHLSYRPRGAKKNVALVGKGICFDTGGHNLKPARYMAGMHEDMNGSAVALAILHAAQALKLPVALDVWLAIAHNHLSPEAYAQGDVVTALDGSTIEVVHTDAEGRMVLADTLVLAARGQPDLTIDFATLTGSMVSALGNRYSGVFASDSDLAHAAVRAGKDAGERVCVFPMDEDYEAALDSKVADIKQCTLEGAADHILAARFLRRFVGERPWLHVDLSACSCEGGLGAAAGNLTGFGVAWGLTLLNAWASQART
ncbi:MAG: leucyl aminopeptidase family protein [Rhodocyclaceae bacterium]|jgi:leucyl aminopeptidase|nr:leucyl aminopeptidase family protein [Rhodocyclaceae bacterium]MBK6554114.1 leucyl aminopeptidase family protein [Rhodocyclaceae bacterium]MBK9310603.1 leucyl aminopeptidase family protein [Rhodocyclaceae bacterium]MBK9954326.1 leucyl aminopeptidase family protein [Rhodocyclaceae bacterium]